MFSAWDYVESYIFKLSEKCLVFLKTLLPVLRVCVCLCGCACVRACVYVYVCVWCVHRPETLTVIYFEASSTNSTCPIVVGFERNEGSFIRIVKFSMRKAYAWYFIFWKQPMPVRLLERNCLLLLRSSSYWRIAWMSKPHFWCSLQLGIFTCSFLSFVSLGSWRLR